MSRSFKKTPYAGDKKDSYCKNRANRKIRRSKDVQDGKQYKKEYCSWMICDYYDITSWEDFWNWHKDDYADKDEARRDWLKMYKRK